MEINENMEQIMTEDNDPILPEGWTEKDDIFSDNWTGAAEEDDFFADTEPSFEDEEDEPAEKEPTTAPEQQAAPAEETAEETTEEHEPPTTEETEPAQEPIGNKLRFKARIDHEDVDAEIDEHDLPTIYQKAVATDRYQQKLAKASPVLERLERMAKLNGYESAEAMLDAQERFDRDSTVERLVKEGTPKEIAEDYVSRKYGQAPATASAEVAAEAGREPATAQNQEPQARDFGAEIRELWDMRPDLKGTRLPAEVAAAAAKGQNLTLAYLDYENKQVRATAETLRKENEIFKQNAAAAAKAPVKGVTGGGATDTKPKDPFLEGFDADYM